MLEMTTHNFLGFTRKEIWFYNGEPVKEGTYNSFSAAKVVTTSYTKDVSKYHSAVIDLNKTKDELLKGLHPRLRYDIQLAERIAMEFVGLPDPTEQECIAAMNAFNLFAKEKEIPPMPKAWILAARKSRKLFLTKIRYEGQDVVTHIFLYDDLTMLNTHSYHNINFTVEEVSKFGNKLLHWKDILYFKERGFTLYSMGPINPELKGITQFKMNFGSQLEENYRYLKASPMALYLIGLVRKLIPSGK